MSAGQKKTVGRGVWQIYTMPLILAILSGVGLIEALLVEGNADILWSLAIGLPLAAILYALYWGASS